MTPTGFDAFWAFWKQYKRHTDGPGKCRKEYERQMRNGASPDDLLMAAQWHVRNTNDLAFIPLASTWLHSENWRDEADKERAYVERRAAFAEQQNIIPMRRAEPQPMSEAERAHRAQFVSNVMRREG